MDPIFYTYIKCLSIRHKYLKLLKLRGCDEWSPWHHRDLQKFKSAKRGSNCLHTQHTHMLTATIQYTSHTIVTWQVKEDRTCSSQVASDLRTCSSQVASNLMKCSSQVAEWPGIKGSFFICSSQVDSDLQLAIFSDLSLASWRIDLAAHKLPVAGSSQVASDLAAHKLPVAGSSQVASGGQLTSCQWLAAHKLPVASSSQVARTVTHVFLHTGE